jgi:phosphoglycerate dehydrogenase-like enzyme
LWFQSTPLIVAVYCRGVPVDVWIPPETAAQHRALLPQGVTVHDLPAGSPLPERLGRGEFLVADYNRPRVLEAIARLEDLRVVQTMAAGVDSLLDHIPPGVTLCDAAGVHDVPIAEWVVMTMLAAFHNLPEHLEAQRSGTWRRAGLDGGGDDLEGATILIVGYGSIGRALESRLAPFGGTILRVARHQREGVHPLAHLPAMLPQADVVVILLPLTAETRGLVDAQFLAAMRPGALLMNPARGPIVDTEALTQAVQAGRVRVALDVTDPEPLPDGHPLWSAPGVIITPHVGGAVRKLYDRAWRLIADQVRRYATGEPLRNVVVDGY